MASERAPRVMYQGPTCSSLSQFGRGLSYGIYAVSQLGMTAMARLAIVSDGRQE